MRKFISKMREKIYLKITDKGKWENYWQRKMKIYGKLWENKQIGRLMMGRNGKIKGKQNILKKEYVRSLNPNSEANLL